MSSTSKWVPPLSLSRIHIDLKSRYASQGGPVSIQKVPVVQPSELKPGQALVRVEYSGVCHTDLHAMLGDWPLPVKLPLIGGHEGAGRVVAINDATSPLKIGDKVRVLLSSSVISR